MLRNINWKIGAYKIRVPENYYPLGVNNEGRFYFKVEIFENF